MRARFDAVIVGAGVAGSSCAILLAQAGWSVAVIEKHQFPRRKVCGECIAASNLALLDALGIGEAFRAVAGPPLQRVAWCAGQSMIEAALPALADDDHPWGRALGREHLDTLLLDRARELGATILQPWVARSIRQVDGVQHCTVMDCDRVTCEIAAPILIAAHGSWQAGPIADESQHHKRASDMFAFKANFSSARLPAGVLPVLAFSGGYGGMVQGDHNMLTLACCIRRDRLQRWRADHASATAGEAVQKLLERDILAVRETLRGAHREGAWLSVGPIRPRIGAPLRANGVLAVGNAAGEAHPILGEGISMALQSAFLLCQQLLGGNSNAGREYARAWRRAFARRIRLAAIYAQVAMHPAATRIALPLLRRWPTLLSVGARWGGKISCVVDLDRAFLPRA